MSAPQERDLRAIVREGAAYSVMVGAGEAYIPAFALAIGLTASQAGLIGATPILIGSLFQLVTPIAARRVGSYRKWATGCTFLQALTFLPLVATALHGGGSFPTLLGLASLYWAFGLAMTPAWNAWVTALVPAERRAVFFAHRTRWSQLSLVISLVGAGLLLEQGRLRGIELEAFATLFLLSFSARSTSAWLLSQHSEPAGLTAQHEVHGPRGVWREVREAGSIPVLAYLIALQTTVNIAAPFFTPYMLGPLGLSYQQFMALTAVAFVARVFALPQLGKIAEARGTRAVLRLGGLGVVPLPALWLLSNNFFYLFALQCLSGFVWAAIELATTLSFFEGIEDRDRASVLSVFNVANSIAIASGAAIGSTIMSSVGDASVSAFIWLFLTSSAARVLTLPLLTRARAPRRVPVDVSLRTMAVRPSVGAMQRPVLATFPEKPPETPCATSES